MFTKYKHYIILVLLLGVCFNTSAEINVSPGDSISEADKGVVNIAYGTQSVREVSSSVSAVSAGDLKRSFGTNIKNSLYGRLPGLTILQQGNEAGYDTPLMFSRGRNTFGGAGTAPLIVIDGVEGSLKQFNAHEIESITLLKDAASTAIYGNRGANGVLLVTTKRGEAGPLRINFNVETGLKQFTHLPQFLNSYDYARLYNEALENDGASLRYSQEELENYRMGSDPYLFPDVNWHDEILRDVAPVSNYNLNFSGGDNSLTYYVSLNALSSDGLYRRSSGQSDYTIDKNFNRYNLHSNVDIKLTNRITTSLDLGGVIEDKFTPAGDNTGSVFNMMSFIPPNAFPVTNPDGSWGGSLLYSNPLGDIMESGFYTSNSRHFRTRFQTRGDLDMIADGLSVTTTLSYITDFKSYSNKTRQYERYSFAWNDETEEYAYTTIGQNTQLVGDEGRSDQWRNLTFQTFLNYLYENDSYKMDAMVMYNYKNYSVIGPTAYYTTDGSVFPYENAGIGGRFTNVINNRYVGEFSFAYNGTENFTSGNRFGFFPAVSLGWIVSGENFLRGADAVDFLKIRTSYGMTGNDNIGGERFMFEPNFPGGSGYYFGTGNVYRNGLIVGRPANPYLTWEKDRKFNFGLDASFLNRFDVTLEYFDQKRYDILVTAHAEVPAFLGQVTPQLNAGEVSNRGIEASVHYRSDQSRSFRYFAGANFWYSRNEILYNAEALQSENYLFRAGHPVGQPFMLEAVGFFESWEDIENSPQQVFAEVQPGDIKYKDQNGDGIIDALDFYPIGNSNIPKFNLGLNGGFSYGGFYLDFLLQGVTGRSVYLSGRDYHAFQGDAKVSAIALGRWTPENSGAATYPRLSASDNQNNYQYSSFWQHDGSFIKLRNMQLGYNLPQSITNRIRCSHANIFISGTNLFSLDYLDYSDPETISGYPPLRTFSLGASIEF